MKLLQAVVVIGLLLLYEMEACRSRSLGFSGLDMRMAFNVSATIELAHSAEFRGMSEGDLIGFQMHSENFLQNRLLQFSRVQLSDTQTVNTEEDSASTVISTTISFEMLLQQSQTQQPTRTYNLGVRAASRAAAALILNLHTQYGYDILDAHISFGDQHAPHSAAASANSADSNDGDNLTSHTAVTRRFDRLRRPLLISSQQRQLEDSNDASLLAYSLLESPHQVTDDLCFFVLADWGKGGLYGDITNATQINAASSSSSSSSSGSSGGKSGGNKSNKNKGTFTYQAAIASAMATLSNTELHDLTPKFVAALGDNFYTEGVASTTDSLWTTIWRNVYLDRFSSVRGVTMAQLPWYAVFGNHDYGYGSTGTAAQIQRSKESIDGGLWNFPSQYYVKTFDIPANGSLNLHSSAPPPPQQTLRDDGETQAEGSSSETEAGLKPFGWTQRKNPYRVHTVFIDTTTLAPSQNKCCNENGGISTELQQQRISEQLSFIDQALYDATHPNLELSGYDTPPTWLIVAGHYPVYSTGNKGDGYELRAYLEPLLRKYNVHAYFCGHDHVSEHLSANGVHYFTAGAGSMTDSVGVVSSSADKVHWSGGGFSAFVTVTASLTDFTVMYFNINGTVVYQYTLTNPNLYPGSGSDYSNPRASNAASESHGAGNPFLKVNADQISQTSPAANLAIGATTLLALAGIVAIAKQKLDKVKHHKATKGCMQGAPRSSTYGPIQDEICDGGTNSCTLVSAQQTKGS